MDTKKIRISDKVGRVLSFDLVDILELIEPFVNEFDWYIYFLETEFVKDNYDLISVVLDRINKDSGYKSPIRWKDLILIGKSIQQTIDMDLEGSNRKYRIFIRAIDTSYWEVDTNCNEIIDMIKSNFNKVELLNCM